MEGDRRSLEFVSTLGVGGFGAVYLANLHGRDRFVRRVAVKVMREGLEATADLVARQKDEARLLGLLAHDAIVQVIDLAEVDGRPAVVMEYVEGVDLAELQKANGSTPMPLRAALEIVAAVAGALDAAYNTPSTLTGRPLRVIHRDIKPANILLTPHGRVKVLDFGVAKADFERDGHTTNGGWGTPRFMSPEQWLGESYGAAIDVYALGVTLFDLVASRPWERPPLARASFEARVAEQIDLVPELPEEVQRLLASMTSFDAEDRPAPAMVREQLESLAAAAAGATLARYARERVPKLVEARSRSNAGQPVPASVSLEHLSTSTQAEPSLALRSDARQPLLAGVLVFAVGGLLLVGSGLGYGVWKLRPRAEPEPAPIGLSEPIEASELPTADAAPLAAEPVAEATVEPVVPPSVTSGYPGSPTATRRESARTAPAGPVRIDPPRAAEGAASPPAAPVAAAGAAPTRETAPAPAPVTLFDVRVQSVPPSAAVWIDGTQVGVTPLTHALPAGAHRVELRLDDRLSTTQALLAGDGAPRGQRYFFDSQEWRVIK